MPLSYENYTGDNATTQFSIPFTYQNTTEISVTVDGVAETGLTFPSSSTVQLTSAPATGAIVQVRRTTDLSARAVDFASGSVLTEEDLDDSAIQTFHAAQEAKDVVNDTITLDTDLKWDADNKVIKDVANPVNLQDAATKNYIENTWLTTSDKAQLNSLNIANLNSVATNLTDVNTVATNISDVNAFAQVYRSGATDPTTSLDVGDLFYNTTSNLLKIWNGSSWETGVAGASGLLPLAGGTMTGNIAFSGSQTVDGRDVSADGNKLDNIEANADVTDAVNVNPLVDAHLNTSTATVDQVLGWTGSDYDWVDNDSGSGDLLAANNLSDLTNTTTARTNLGVAIGSDVQAHSSVLDGTTASFTTAEESKLAGIEASATADQTGAEIKAAYEAEANTNAFTDAEKTKLTGIEVGATADQTDAEIRAAVEAATDSNVFTDADHSKLNAIEAGATADQTGAEIKTAYEAEANTNAFTDAEKTKLTGIEAGATADQTASEIRALVESATDSNVFTDADHTKLNGIEASADVTDVTNVTAAGALMDSEVTNLAQVKSFDSSDYATAAQGTTADAALPRTGGAMTGAITTNSTFDGRDVATDGAKLDGIEAGATADQTGAEIKTAYEAEANTNAFTDAEKTKLTGIEASATADQTAAEIRTLVESATDSNVFTDADHTKLNDISVELYGENPVSATAPTTTGNNDLAIGSGAEAIAGVVGSGDAIAIGTSASAERAAVAIGKNTDAGEYGVAIGSDDLGVGAVADRRNIAIGGGDGAASATGGSGQIAIGENAASTNNFYGTALGQDSLALGNGAFAVNRSRVGSGEFGTAINIGSNTATYGALGNFTFAVGYQAKALNAKGVAIGYQAISTAANEIALGDTSATVRISGAYTLPTADGTNGQVMTTDGSGTVSFTTVSGGGGGGASTEIPILAKTASYTVVAGDAGKIVSFSGGAYTATLTAAATLGSGFFCYIENNAATGQQTHTVTIDPNGSETIDGRTTFIVRQGERVQLVCDGSNFRLISSFHRGIATNMRTDFFNPPQALGDESVAIGLGTIAGVGNTSNAIAIGTNAQAGSAATAIGGSTNAGSSSSTALGKNSGGGGSVTATGSGAMALGGSRASGTNSLAAAITNNTASYGATGTVSIAIGRLAKATAQDAVAIGDTPQATGNSAIALGNLGVASGTKSGVFGGDGNAASGSKSVAIGGYYAEAREESKIAFGGGYIGTGPGTNAYQAGLLCMGADTTDATATILRSSNTAAGTTNQVILPNNSAFSFHGTIVARESAASGTDCAAWKVEGLIRREGSAGTTVLVNSATTVLDNTPSWGMALSADTTNGGLKIEVTGAAATNIRWVGTIHTSEVTYA